MYAKSAAVAVAALSAASLASPVPPTRTRIYHHPNATLDTAVSQETDVDLNWAGAIINAPSGVSYTSAVGTFTVPSCGNPNDGSSGPWYNSFWVGIDGVSGSNDILQSGGTCTANTDGSNSYYAWVEYYPAAEVEIDPSQFTINEGDSVTVTLNVDSPTSGTVVLADSTTGQSFTTSLTAPASTATIVGISAEWIVEDFSSNGLVPFASFSPVTWTGASATGSDGNVYTATEDGFETIVIENSAGNVITSVAANGDDSLTINYTG